LKVIARSLVTAPHAARLVKVSKLNWTRNCDRPKTLCSSYYKVISRYNKCIRLCSIQQAYQAIKFQYLSKLKN
jgi:hypothetical protein